jgi:hypothetical protein
MGRVIKKKDVNKFGKIVAGEAKFKKTLFGTVLYVDHFGAVIFIDNEDFAHKFASNLVDSFEEQEFKDKSE